MILFSLLSFSDKATLVMREKEAVQILIMGVRDNVKSNFYDEDVIAQETGIKIDSIDNKFNSIIANNIAGAMPNSSCKFITHSDGTLPAEMTDKIEVEGDGENCISHLNKLPATELKKTLVEAKADYLLVLNQHYLKRQEKPMRTVFHIVSYTLYDENKKEVMTGHQYFTSMKLESSDKMKQMSRKSTSKIASSVAKVLNL
jgi:hypothetical protein